VPIPDPQDAVARAKSFLNEEVFFDCGGVIRNANVVTGNLAPHGVYAGVPTTRKKALPGAGEQ